jgi:hypothetical protein
VFRQDRTNPSTAVSTWKARKDLPKANPSTAVSAWLNGGLASVAVAYGGYFCGGSDGSTTVDKYLFADDSRTTLGTGLSVNRQNSSGAGNAGVAGYQWGPPARTTCDKFTFPDDTQSVLPSGQWNASLNCAQAGGANVGVAAYTYDQTAAKKMPFSTETLSGVLTYMPSGPTGVGGGCFANSGTAFYWGGGYGSPYTDDIVKLLFSDDTNTILAATLSQDRENNGAAANNGVAGYWYGGNLSGYVFQSTVDKITFASDASSTLGTGLSSARNYTSGMANSGVAGYTAGGYSPTAGASVSTIDKFAFPSDSRSTLGTGLSAAKNAVGSMSNQEALI